MYATINLFSHVFLAIVNELCKFQNIIPDDTFMLYFSSSFSRTKLNFVLLWKLLVSMYPLSKLGTFPPLSVMFKDFSLYKGVPQLQNSICRSLGVFNKQTISLEDTTSFVQSYLHRGSCYSVIVLFVLFQFLILSLDFSSFTVFYTFYVRLFQTTCCWQALK